MFTALAKLATRRPKRVVVGAVVLFVAAAALGGNVAQRLGPYGADDPATESVRASDLVARGGVQPGVDFVALGPRDARLDRLAARLRREPAARSCRRTAGRPTSP
jgi:RND superfamily putative drug exporter